MTNESIRVIVVDDSPFIRHTLVKYLNAKPDIEVIGEASDGLYALTKIQQLKPDVVTLDVQMPRLDGLSALQRIMAECPTPVVMLSSYTKRGTRITIQALMQGAADFVTKPTTSVNIHSVIDELAEKIRAAKGMRLPSATTVAEEESAAKPQAPARLEPQLYRRGDPLVIIGASTGGPRALRQLLSELPSDLPGAIVVVQHMPKGFTRSLAQRLDMGSAFSVQEAADGDRLAHGVVLVAPSDYHLEFRGSRQVTLNQEPKVNGVRPALDVTLKSAAEQHKHAVITVVLTGMGSDGTDGARQIKGVGGTVLAEHESSCVVYGMPRSVVDAGLADHVVPLPRIASKIVKLVNRARS